MREIIQSQAESPQDRIRFFKTLPGGLIEDPVASVLPRQMSMVIAGKRASVTFSPPPLTELPGTLFCLIPSLIPPKLRSHFTFLVPPSDFSLCAGASSGALSIKDIAQLLNLDEDMINMGSYIEPNSSKA